MAVSPVPRALLPYVTAIVAYDVDVGAPGIHRGLPGPEVTLELPLDQPLDVEWAGRPASRRREWSCVSGLHTRAATIHHDGRQHGVSVHLTVAGARALLGLPSGELAGQLATLDEVDPGLRHLPEALADAPGDAVATTARALLDALARRGEPAARAEVGRALARLTRGARVAETAADVGYSRRRLQDLVRAECGLSPGDLRRVARLARSRQALVLAVRDRRGTLADVAAVTGYADHAHMTRDWAALAGCTPSTWVREEFPFVQDVPVDGTPGW